MDQSSHHPLGVQVLPREIAAAIDAFARLLDKGDPFYAAFRMTPTAMAVSDPTLRDNPIIYVNRAFEQLTGFASREVLGRNCRFMQGPDTDLADVEAIRAAIKRRERIEIDLLNHRRDGSPFWNRLMVAPVFDDRGAPRYFVASQIDVTIERHQLPILVGDRESLAAEVQARAADLADQDARLRMALKAGGLGTWTLTLPELDLQASSGCKRNFGRPVDKPFTYPQLVGAVHPDDLPRMQAEVRATIENGTPYHIEYRILTPDGEQRWVAVHGELQFRADGSLFAMSGFSTDISERKFIDEHRAVLARELSHRVKNTLATVSAVVSQTLRDAPSIAAATEAVQGRIAAMATAHDLLIKDEIEGASIGDIVKRVLSPFIDAGGARFDIGGPPVRLSPQITLALSMALYELATNAIKYGALSTPDGQVTVKWSLDVSSGARFLSFTWKEQGGPLVQRPTKSGFGTRMIERVLQSYVQGRSTVQFLPEGLRFELAATL